MGYYVKNRRFISGSTSMVVPAGDSADRPLAPVFGSFRYNTELGALEYFNGTVFVTLAQVGAESIVVDSFTGDGSTLTFSMSVPADDTQQIMVFVGSIYQQPDTYVITGAGNDITFTGAPPSGSPINVIHNLGAA